MGLLAVTIAASSAFYIRRVRAAQRAETEQRQRAESAEKDSQAEALRATRLATYFYAGSLLAQSRVKEAYEKALESNVPPARWEDGRLLQEVVSRSREHWQVVARIGDAQLNTEVGPGSGCFVRRGDDDWVVIIPRGASAEIYHVPGGEHVGRIALGTTAGPMCPGPLPSQLVLSAGKTIMLWNLSSMQQLFTVEAAQPLVQIVTHSGASAIAALDSDGVVAIHASENIRELARSKLSFPARPNLARASQIDLSPSGQRVVAHSGLWTDGIVLWDWKTDQMDTRRVSAHSAIFEDEETIAGYWNWGMGMDQSAIWRLALTKEAGPKDPIWFTDLQSKTTARISIWTREDTGRRRVGIVGREGIDIRAYPSGSAVIASDRYTSILPLSSRIPRVIAHDLPHELLLLQGDELLLLRRRNHAPWERDMNGWSLATCDRGMLTCEWISQPGQPVGAALTLTPFDGAATRTYRLEWPTPAGMEVLPWGIWSPPDGSFVAVLRQEAEAGDYAGTVGGKYFGRAITFYDTAGWPEDGAVLKIKKKVELPNLSGRPTRDNRFIAVTPDGQVALHVSGNTAMARYRVADGKLLSQQPLGQWAEVSQDGRLLASGGLSNKPVKVWDIASGEVVFTTPDEGITRKGCFSQDAKQLCVSWSDNELVWYDLPSQKRVRSIRSKLLPCAVPASGDRFVAFMPDTTTTGDTVLASSIDGEVTAMLTRGAYITNAAWYAPSGTRVALVKYRDLAELICSLTVSEAQAALRSVDASPATVIATTEPATRPASAPVIIAQIPRPATATSRKIAPGTIAWEDAADYVDKPVVIEFKVVNTRNIQSRCFLNPAPLRRGNFTVVLRPAIFDKWPQAPETWFYNKTIRVRGTVVLYRGSPEIEVDDAKQIEVIQEQ